MAASCDVPERPNKVMRFDFFSDAGLGAALEQARWAEEIGYSGFWTGEAAHDPFLPLAAATGATTRVTLGTGIAVAFARSPMTIAYQAWDLAHASRGRFVLGLGPQVRAHVTRRFSMPWGEPVARMREMIAALRAIFHAWQGGEALDFRGRYYTHTLMAPYFAPAALQEPEIPILLAAVGPRMQELAAEVGHGVLLHPFNNLVYLRERVEPALVRGAAAGGRSREDLIVGANVFLITGTHEEDVAGLETQARRQIAFYGSTPHYRDVLAVIGYGDLQPELHRLAREGRWSDMTTLIEDDLLDHFAVRGTLREVARQVRGRYRGHVDRIASYYPIPATDDELAAFVEEVQT